MENTAKIKIVFFAILVIFLSGCSQEGKHNKTESEVNNIEQNVTQKVNTFTLSNVGDDGESNWQLEGESADIADNDINLTNVLVKSQSKDANVTMKAKKGLIKKNEDKGEFKDDVVLVYDDGTTMNTDAIDWSFKKQTANAKGPVLVKSGGLETKADGACLKKGVNEIRLDRNILMKTDSGTIIKCSGPLMLDYKKNIAVFNKDVEITNQKGNMKSKKMVVFFDPEKKEVSKVEASGNVRLVRGKSISMSDRALYFAKEGRAVLTGNPIVFVDSEEARAATKEQNASLKN